MKTLGPESIAAKYTPLFEEERQCLVEISGFFESAAARGFLVNLECSDLIGQVSEPFSLFVCGEFNGGKSSLINSLTGENLAEVGILPTTREVTPLSSKKLQGLMLVDSPGTNSIVEGHQEVTEKYLMREIFLVFQSLIRKDC